MHRGGGVTKRKAGWWKTAVRVLAIGALASVLSCCDGSVVDGATKRVPDPQIVLTALIWAPDWSEQMHQIAADFSRTHPHIRINLQFMIGDSVEENIAPRVASNNLPDLMSVNPNAYAAHLADQDMLVDLAHQPLFDDMLEQLKPDWTSPTGKQFGVSGGVAATLMYYNQRLFAAAGIKRAPANFDEFLQVCERLKQSGVIPIVWTGGFPNMLGNGPFSAGFANNVVARVPDWKARLAAGTLALDNPAGADIFGKIRLIARRGYVQPDFMRTSYEQGIRLFTEGRVAMTFHGTWAAGRLMHGQGFATGTFIPPWNAPGETAVPILGSETGFAIGATAHRAAALEFLKYIMGPGFAAAQHKRHNITPMQHPAPDLVADPVIAAYLAQVARYRVTGSPYYAFLPAETISLTHTLLQDVLAERTSPQQAARALDRSLKSQARLAAR